ncbi:hypothetical protein CcaverHIS002_0409860 [Cutaneotrichosporon cavernicola]|uniref:Uncharacterized protein n=1 Tax=Cutaneotrichosporon cavernicola TaxID=279322 RepID=A0AA48L585_9TREE|nr:uncharacterized protein CcaverHIS019_0409780 [Cutaneotrichosporon cavernicola]BEI84382.1 hypothetical protein CcaverHIS002_0409860 [Cutaneotrichosporon cavernicola]BEI92158.1 hypothetical protein CcaverHIS019_0409780 [Cutaneotrichosporon cavernicola]BEI99928.1 hypothetical protein CcaverHIS631_0409710 [Cutaneotrichosporon cavernicola]BEJ07703.1 hypothetical protein CcaverHIS641_0409720 [Cutaneotrichosporon cavernicola]
MSAASSPPFSENALNRFRITHPDQTRSLARRLNRLPHLPQTNLEAKNDAETEVEIARLEAQRWKFGVERTLATVAALDRQRDEYTSKTADTVSRTEELRRIIAAEKEQLAREQAERDYRMRCDDVARKIQARGKTRAELQAEIEALEASIVEHREGFDAVLDVARRRVETFTRIGSLMEECRALKMPQFDDEAPEAARESNPEPKLKPTALPFQPRVSGANAAPTRAASPAVRNPAPAPGSRTPAATHGHGLPARPASRSGQRYTTRPTLPQRPGGSRTIPGLEDGEVGEEDGEVKENGKRRAADEVGRNTRQRR